MEDKDIDNNTEKTITTYKPKKVNVEKLITYLSKQKTNK